MNQPLPPDESQLCDTSQSCDLKAPAEVLDPDVLDADAWQALREAGVGEPARTELSNLPMVTAWYIRAMAAGARAEGVGIGALIYRIRNDWPAPDWCDQCGGLEGQHADDCPDPATPLGSPRGMVERRARQALGEQWADGRAQAQLDREAREAAARAAPPMSADMQAAAVLWQRALGELQLQLTGATYNTWLGRARVIGRENGTLIVGVHNAYAKDWLENRLSKMVNHTLTGLAGHDLQVRFVVTERVGGHDGNTQG